MQIQPRKGALNHPPSRQEHKAYGRFTAHDHLQDEAEALGYPIDQRATLANVNPDAPQLFATAAESCKQQPRAITLWQTGSGDCHDQ